ncbi:hypothetical protein BDV25DRAFT_169933 [Aspergillus avenaceus]|uniref:DUF7905 domain-containing protein n=1 Tax=Aspergillus avenaceus TaxID=36643 RepID=A0A5N6U2M8_ASPAV|nr:hypothetical protein BDV25DRAFT_169933 [Aspergillus avenaceus]
MIEVRNDHETSGAQEWTIVSHDKRSLKTRGQRSRPANNLPRAPVVNGSDRDETQKQQPLANTTSPRHSQAALPLRSRGGMVRSPRQGGRTSGRRAYSSVAASHQPSNLLQDSPAKSRWRAGDEPSGTVKLPATFGTFKHEFYGVARSSLATTAPSHNRGRYEVFEDISHRTGAYVRPPSYTDSTILLWGESSDVTAASDALKRLLVKCSGPATGKKADWAKINAYSANKEFGADMKERRENMLLLLRKQPDLSTAFPEQVLFLWPQDGPSIHESLGLQLEGLDTIRAKFGCHLFSPRDVPGYICAVGHNHQVMKQIAQLIRTKWGEVMANSNIRLKAYIVEPPQDLRGDINVERHDHFGKASPSENRARETPSGKWCNRRGLIKTSNDARIFSAVEKSLQGVSYVRGHLRMRVNLGSFILDEYRKTEDGATMYSFEEFREMLLHEQTKGRLVPGLKVGQGELLARCFAATDLLESYESVSCALKDAEPAYSANFEFFGSNNALLRLEAEFVRSPGAHNYEVTQRRWLRPRKGGQASEKRPPLQIGVIDFERADWQLEIKSLDFYETSAIDTALRSFSHTIRFRKAAAIGGISARAQRKVMFPDSAPVSRFIEKTAIRYRLKGTKYILEIARYDEYSRTHTQISDGQVAPTITGRINETPSTSWGASIFDLNWDNLMGEHANLSVGQSARYWSNLDTFFPANEPSNKKGAGFWELIPVVKQVAQMLGPNQTRSSTKPTEPFSTVSKENQIHANESSAQDIFGLDQLLDDDLGTLF